MIPFVALAAMAFGADTTPPSPPPVVVELFTSEGCSSCPPADRLLAELEKQFGAKVIVLSEHVDYWNYIGWRDPFSSADFSARQKRYENTVGGEAGVYTPQMVIDGRTGFVGNDGKRALTEIQKASSRAKVQVTVAKNGDVLAISTAVLPSNANILVAITEGNLETDVRKGENSGRKLRHTAVTRTLSTLGKGERGKSFTAEFTPKIDASWKRADLRAVILIEDKSSHQILGAATLPL